MSKELNRIPIGKVRRASKFVTTGAKVGANYVKAYSKAALKGKLDQNELDNDNARDIYDSLSELKGSALKMAQLLSMDQNVLPKAYADKFSMAQYSAPPLSYPLVKKTFIDNMDKEPNEIFDTFGKSASNAASMGQVHKAELNGQKLAVKVQYPGVADSIKSDLKLAKPFALKLMNVKGKDVDPYMKEVEGKLLEEADYTLELRQSMDFAQKCENVDGVFFPTYFPELSSPQILTMSWLNGEPIGAWMKHEQKQPDRDRLGQILWNFYMYQMHELRMMHADPHPGNFIIDANNNLGVIDFGCIKHIPKDFYDAYFELTSYEVLDNPQRVDELFRKLEIIRPDDPEKDVKIVTAMFTDLIRLLSRPFNEGVFDFSDDRYFTEIYMKGEAISKDPEMNRLQARGSRHFIYFNRTFFGLYNILHALKAKVDCSTKEIFKVAS
ncbi:Predicted unusual protein kinase regulating ubiquinone biosynthesis, AarF/ABC1/UbiB family [Ekhidna lutea]|uniref:Predicted unusual protein kinase regulating ubiquinone biosynthesis, AarF/ABC1/UbiB family n=1 Tax=Ekhidna lutea TaxID=447679 RepID=A0A239HNX1_EKHLU|nr:AarF/ABC1/UbiB kinase family protein [Ekhidna lutea]SNS82871.1 Predicted unusual protein kinase regulating ubiquinone biosynthesis, AarF/ABC1/UbiB family [Ekhidna lutea]